MKKSKYKAEEAGHYGGARLTVMQPTVVNENNVPREVPSENMSRHGCDDCGHQNSENCNTCPELCGGVNETAINDVNLDYQREDGK